MRPRRRRQTPRAASTSSAAPPAPSTTWAGARVCRNKPACGSRSNCPRSVALTEIQFTSSAVAGGRGGAPSVWTAPRGYQVQVSADGQTWSAPVAEGQGDRGHHDHHVRAGPREVRPDHADRDRARCASVVDAAAAAVRGGSLEVGFRLRCSGAGVTSVDRQSVNRCITCPMSNTSASDDAEWQWVIARWRRFGPPHP